MADAQAVRQRAMELLRRVDDLEEPEAFVMPIFMDSILIVEAYRRARHEVANLPELTRSVDALLRELEIVDKTRAWAGGDD
jgi:hypothetical protein